MKRKFKPLRLLALIVGTAALTLIANKCHAQPCPAQPLNYPCDASGNPTYSNYDEAMIEVQQDTINVILRRIIKQAPLVVTPCPAQPLNYPCDASGNPTYTSYDLANIWIQQDSTIALLRKLSAAAGGSVTSVGFAAPSTFTITGSPITTAGTITMAATVSTGYLLNTSGSLTWKQINSNVKDSAWLLTGNSGTSPGTNFIGTKDAQAFEIKVNGNKSGWIDYSSPDITAFGYNTALVNTGSDNTFMGYQAGEDQTSGNNCTFIGSNAGATNTTSSQVTAIGAFALGKGVNNTCIGYSVMGNHGGMFNVAMGVTALDGPSGSNSSYNTAVGYNSIFANTTGFKNSGLGYQSLINNTSGSYNIGIGDSALYNLTTANNSIGIGDSIRSFGANTARWGNTQIANHYLWNKVHIYGTGSLSIPVQVSTATTGTVISNGSQILELDGVGITGLTITLPASPVNGQLFEVTTSQVGVVTLTFSGVLTPPPSITSATPLRLYYSSNNSEWLLQ